VVGVHGRRCWGAAADQSGVQKGQEKSFLLTPHKLATSGQA
jgi:hypothetical protein